MAEVKFEDNSKEFLEAMDQQVRNALWAIGATAEGYAKDELYDGHGLDTGRLRNSISHAEDESEMAVYIGTNVEYAPYVENGTSKMSAIPFLRPAVTDHTDEYKSLLESALKS